MKSANEKECLISDELTSVIKMFKAWLFDQRSHGISGSIEFVYGHGSPIWWGSEISFN